MSVDLRTRPVVGSESEDGVKSSVVRALSKSVSIEGFVEVLSIASIHEDHNNSDDE